MDNSIRIFQQRGQVFKTYHMIFRQIMEKISSVRLKYFCGGKNNT